MEALLEALRPRLERLLSLSLFPTYSYFRVYKRGDALARHTDREPCEISLSLNLGLLPEQPWGLWIEGPKGADQVELCPGDGLLYKGIERPHWREPFAGEQAAQVFLHYVDQAGPYAHWRFDKRPSLGAPSVGL